MLALTRVRGPPGVPQAAASAAGVQNPVAAAAPPAGDAPGAGAWLRASLARRASLASDSGASASESDAEGAAAAVAPNANAAPNAAPALGFAALAPGGAGASAAETRLERARAKASKLSRALEARARAALAERASYFAALDDESLEEASPGSVATSARPPRPEEEDDDDVAAAVHDEEATPQRALSAIFGAAAARAAAAVEAVKAELKAPAMPVAAAPSPGAGGLTPGATPERAVARTSAWVRGLPARFSLGGGVARIAEETDDDAAEAAAAPPGSAGRSESSSGASDSAVWPSSEEASATASVSDDASPMAPAPVPAVPQPRTSLGLSRRASLGFGERASGGVGRRSSVAGAPRVSLVGGVRRLSVADDAAQAAAPPPRASLPLAGAAAGRRGSGATPARASMAPGRQSLAPFAAIAEAEDDESELADDVDHDEALAEAEAAPDDDDDVAAVAEPLPRTPLRADALGTALRRASMRASLAAAGEAAIDENEEDAGTEADVAEAVAFPEDFEDAASMFSDAPCDEPLCALDGLLRLCGQGSGDVLPMADALQRWLQPAEASKGPAKGGKKGPKAVRKLGEGTYGEAFKCPGVVLKVRIRWLFVGFNLSACAEAWAVCCRLCRWAASRSSTARRPRRRSTCAPRRYAFLLC